MAIELADRTLGSVSAPSVAKVPLYILVEYLRSAEGEVSMAHNASVLKAVEQLGYRATVGDVAAAAGLPLAEAQREMLALATDVQADLQVSEAGDIAYQFPHNMQAVLLGKYWQMRFQALWSRIWQVLFYLIRVSFGIMLILSLLLIVVAIGIIVLSLQASQQGNNEDDRRDYGGGGGGGFFFFPRFWVGDVFYLFDFNYGRGPSRRKQRNSRRENQLNFLEAIFSFLFGDGNPNADLDERRWQDIAGVIRNNRGAVVAEQIAPFLDDVGGKGWSQEDENYMIPVLSRFNGYPEVSPEGQLVYHFPELQVMAESRKRTTVSQFLQEIPRRFSQATSGQVMGAIALGSFNFIGALVLGYLLRDPSVAYELGGLVAFANSIYWILLGYGSAFLALPLVRYFWVQQQNKQIEARNDSREERAIALTSADEVLKGKLAFARQFAAQTIVSQEDLAYTTERDLIEQEVENRDKIDEEWQRRVRESNR